MRVLNLASRCLLAVVGVLCIIFSSHLLAILPYLLGSAMLLAGLVRTVDATGGLRRGDTSSLSSDGLSRAILLMLLGVITCCKGSQALSFIGVSWGLLGLMKGGRALAGAIDAILERRRFWGNLLRAAVEIALGCLLLFHPVEKVQTHLEILGVEIIAYALLRVRTVGAVEEA